MTSSKQSPTGLARVLSLWDLVFIVLGTVIGSGIFILPGAVLRQVGGRLDVSIAVWVIGGILSLLGALTFGELGAMAPEAGGIYIYIRDAFGRLPAFLYGWTFFFVVASGSVATLAVASKDYLKQLVSLSPAMEHLIPVVLIAFCTVINVRGTRESARVQAWTTTAKVVAIAGGSLALLLSSPVRSEIAPAATSLLSGQALFAGAGLAMIATLWAYEGWQYVTFSAGEANDPQRTFPLGIALGTAAVVGLYLLAIAAYVHTLGVAGVTATDRVAADAVSAVFGANSGRAVAVLVEIAIFSALNSVVLTSPRVFYAMARDQLFFRRLADVHPKFGTPAFAIIAGSLWSTVLAVSGTYQQLFTYVILTGWTFYAVGACTVFWYRRNRPNITRPFRVPGYPLTPALFFLSALIVLGDTMVSHPGWAAIWLGTMVIGTGAYFVWRRWSASGEKTRPAA
jgi:APA family basic amino acid/polyamine antiporter